MPCCGQRTIHPRVKAKALAPTTDMLYAASMTTLVGLDSRRYSLTGPLLKSPGRPAGGWRAVLPIKGQSVEVAGRSALECYNAAVIVLGRNGIKVPPADIWLSLNIQWYNRTPEKYHIIRLSNLMTIARGLDIPETERDKRKRSYKPSDWGKWAWGWLNLFLAREEFHYRDFMLQLKYVLDITNPDTNPEIGCAECYRDFTIMVSRIANKPAMTREEARKWLVDAHNQVNKKIGKKTLTFEEASKAAFWI